VRTFVIPFYFGSGQEKSFGSGSTALPFLCPLTRRCPCSVNVEVDVDVDVDVDIDMYIINFSVKDKNTD
jgi:hypothetical protein